MFRQCLEQTRGCMMDLWCIWWLCPHLPDSDGAMNISGVMNQICMIHSQISYLYIRIQNGGCEAVCMMKISVCWYFVVICKAYSSVVGLFVCFISTCFQSRACFCSQCRIRPEGVVIVWESKRTLCKQAGMWCCPAGHLDGFFQVSNDYSRQLSVIVKSGIKAHGHQDAVCDLIRCVYKLNISWFNVGLSAVLLHCSQ